MKVDRSAKNKTPPAIAIAARFGQNSALNTDLTPS
jgi:hypothetical protein